MFVTNTSDVMEVFRKSTAEYQSAYNDGFKDALRAMQKELGRLERIETFPTSTGTSSN